MNKQWKLTVGAAALAMSFSAQAGVVDLFSVSQATLTDVTAGDGGLASQVSDAPDPGSILTGYRDIGVDLLTSPFGTVASIQVTGGALSFSSGSSSTATGIVQWDGDDNATPGALNLDGTTLDLTAGGTLSAFEVSTIFSDLGYEFLIGAYTSAAQWTVISFLSSNVPLTPAGVLSYIPFSGFTNVALCGAVNPAPGVNYISCGSGNTAPVNLAALDALELVLDPNGGTVSLDLTLNSVRTVPEPGVLALVGMGLMAAGFTSRRRKSQA